ncbi:hypothetical protein PMAYCL1PPCAC_03496, partial [Pristionchus mayeri]
LSVSSIPLPGEAPLASGMVVDCQDTVAPSVDESIYFRKLTIRGLTPNTTEEMLRDFYGQFGEVTDAVVFVDDCTMKTKGFGFVTYTAKAMVDECQRARPHMIDGKEVEARRASINRGTSDPGNTNKLYVSGVHREYSEEVLQAYFSKFGAIKKIEIVRDQFHLHGLAYVTFDDYDSVDQCVMIKSHDINGHRCEVKKRFSREEARDAQQAERDREYRRFRFQGVMGGEGVLSQGGDDLRGYGSQCGEWDGEGGHCPQHGHWCSRLSAAAAAGQQRGWGGLTPRAERVCGRRAAGRAAAEIQGRYYMSHVRYDSGWSINMSQTLSNMHPPPAPVRQRERRGRVEFYSMQYPLGRPYPY